jgi:hypothetical protein
MKTYEIFCDKKLIKFFLIIFLNKKSWLVVVRKNGISIVQGTENIETVQGPIELQELDFGRPQELIGLYTLQMENALV